MSEIRILKFERLAEMRAFFLDKKSMDLKEKSSLFSELLYPEPESNRHALRHWCLRPTRLPIPPPGLVVRVCLVPVTSVTGCKYEQRIFFLQTQFSTSSSFFELKACGFSENKALVKVHTLLKSSESRYWFSFSSLSQ